MNWNMLIRDELILPLLHKHDRMQHETWKHERDVHHEH
jgi:hypothetical protein